MSLERIPVPGSPLKALCSRGSLCCLVHIRPHFPISAHRSLVRESFSSNRPYFCRNSGRLEFEGDSPAPTPGPRSLRRQSRSAPGNRYISTQQFAALRSVSKSSSLDAAEIERGNRQGSGEQKAFRQRSGARIVSTFSHPHLLCPDPRCPSTGLPLAGGARRGRNVGAPLPRLAQLARDRRETALGGSFSRSDSYRRLRAPGNGTDLPRSTFGIVPSLIWCPGWDSNPHAS